MTKPVNNERAIVVLIVALDGWAMKSSLSQNDFVAQD